MSLAHDYSDSGRAFGLEQSQQLFRPVQYLGNKLRALDAILEATQALVGKDARVADLFTGTSVVAQGFAGSGYHVTAVDTQRYAVVFGNALLNIGRKVGEQLSLDNAVVHDSSWFSLQPHWEALSDLEQAALKREDYGALISLYESLPLIWRQPSDPYYSEISCASGNCAISQTPLVTTIYSGTYFGVKQALELDKLRNQIEHRYRSGVLSAWQYSAALTALMHAASAAVHSAGKHFAQPLNAGASTNRSFLRKRLFEDRNISVSERFQSACIQINARDHISSAHATIEAPAETFVEKTEQPFDLYYLDPPYTAQQYSRFYHVLETLVSYRFPQLTRSGDVTSGLYPLDRYKSAFSSKSKAPSAFRKILSTAKQRGTNVLISYSESGAFSDGNARMITLDRLLAECSDAFGASNVNCDRMAHKYRQFNSSHNANFMRNDLELLITCAIR